MKPTMGSKYQVIYKVTVTKTDGPSWLGPGFIRGLSLHDAFPEYYCFSRLLIRFYLLFVCISVGTS